MINRMKYQRNKNNTNTYNKLIIKRKNNITTKRNRYSTHPVNVLPLPPPPPPDDIHSSEYDYPMDKQREKADCQKVWVVDSRVIPIGDEGEENVPIPISPSSIVSNKVVILSSCELLSLPPIIINHDPSYEPVQISPPPVEVKPVELLGPETELEALKWVKVGNSYIGSFGERHKNTQGRLEKKYDNKYKIYVSSPPKKIFKGKHKNCFIFSGNGWYHVHFNECDPRDPITMIRTVQSYFDE